MAKTKTVTAPEPVGRLPGDPMTPEEEQSAKDATLATIKAEMEAQRISKEAHDRALAKDLAKQGVSLRLPEDLTPEQRNQHHEDSVSLIQEEMRASQAQNPPRPLQTGAGDQASLDIIRAEMQRSRKRIVLR